jgi:hypothetical protein
MPNTQKVPFKEVLDIKKCTFLQLFSLTLKSAFYSGFKHHQKCTFLQLFSLTLKSSFYSGLVHEESAITSTFGPQALPQFDRRACHRPQWGIRFVGLFVSHARPFSHSPSCRRTQTCSIFLPGSFPVLQPCLYHLVFEGMLPKGEPKFGAKVRLCRRWQNFLERLGFGWCAPPHRPTLKGRSKRSVYLVV